MRSRLAMVLSVVLVLGSLALLGSPAVASSGVTLSQEQPGEDAETEGGEGQDEGGGAGQDDPAAETGADEGQTEEVAEEGPPWTYQMARITIALLVLLGLALVLLYYRLVAQRRKGEV